MSKGVLYDANKCIGCRACQVACKQWNELPAVETTNTGTLENPPLLSAKTFTRLRFREVEHNDELHFVFAKTQCMHCEEPACASACLVKALEKTDCGAVIYDDHKCIGCRYCMMACPFGIPTFEWDEAMPWIRKCTFCPDRQAAGLEPACVATCPTGALKFGDRDDLIAEAKQRVKDSPDKYFDHIYGEEEVGGTCWLYIFPVPFEEMGFPALGTKAMNVDANRAMNAVPGIAVGVTALMAGVYWLTKRKQQMNQEKAEVTK